MNLAVGIFGINYSKYSWLKVIFQPYKNWPLINISCCCDGVHTKTSNSSLNVEEASKIPLCSSVVIFHILLLWHREVK